MKLRQWAIVFAIIAVLTAPCLNRTPSSAQFSTITRTRRSRRTTRKQRRCNKQRFQSRRSRERAQWNALNGVRIGEAANPGPGWPRAQRQSSSPGPCQTSRVKLDPLATARRDVSAGFGQAAPPEKAMWSLDILTMNSTTWLSAKDYIVKHPAAVILLQEHHLLTKDIAAASKWCLQNG